MAVKKANAALPQKRLTLHRGLSGLIFWNLIALVFVKAVFSYSGFQFASLLDGIKIFDKKEVVTQTNVFRKTLGLNELKESPTLDIAAAQKLDDMKRGQYFAHTSPSGISPWHWIEVNQYKYSYAGENLAIGFFSAEETVTAWMNSPSHRANLANSNYKEIGIAVAPAKIQNSEGFLVVQLFGTPKPTIVTQPTSNKPTPATTTKTKIALSPTPTKIKQLKPVATQAIPLSAKPSVKAAEEIKEPIASNIDQSTPTLKKLGQVFNISFIFYALIAFLVSIVLLISRELNKELVAKTAISLALLILAIAVPVLQITHTALIL